MLNKREIICHRVTMVISSTPSPGCSARELTERTLERVNEVLQKNNIKAELYLGPDCADEDFDDEPT